MIGFENTTISTIGKWKDSLKMGNLNKAQTTILYYKYIANLKFIRL